MKIGGAGSVAKKNEIELQSRVRSPINTKTTCTTAQASLIIENNHSKLVTYPVFIRETPQHIISLTLPTHAVLSLLHSQLDAVQMNQQALMAGTPVQVHQSTRQCARVTSIHKEHFAMHHLPDNCRYASNMISITLEPGYHSNAMYCKVPMILQLHSWRCCIGGAMANLKSYE